MTDNEREEMTGDTDRMVHVHMLDGSKIVRYDREGRWYQEWPEDQERPRRALRVRDAAALAVSKEAEGYIGGLPGGGTFDRKVMELNAAKPPEPEYDDQPPEDDES